jgi:hypothetical protein
MVARQTMQSVQASEDILASMLSEARGGGPVSNPTPQRSGPIREAGIPVPDVSKIEVPDAFVTAVLEFTNRGSSNEELIVESGEVEEVNEAVVITNKVQDLVVRLASLIKEARVVLEEMTSVGMIGVGKATGFKKPVKKVNGPTKAIKRN